jgi:hypothetical protein
MVGCIYMHWKGILLRLSDAQANSTEGELVGAAGGSVNELHAAIEVELGGTFLHLGEIRN